LASPPHRLQTLIKTLLQVGPGSLALYALYRAGLLFGHYRRLDRRLLSAASRATVPLKPVFALPARAALAAALSPAARLAVPRDASAVVQGKVRLFGGSLMPLRLGRKQHLRHWTSYETDGSLLKKWDPPHSDVKFLWESARFGWAFILGRAFHLTRDEKYALAFWLHFERFDRGNPPYLGPHWMNGQEVAIRLMALVWTAQVLAPARLSTPRRMRRLASSIAQHAARIPPTLVYARSQNNNHLVTEAVGLYLAGAALDHRPWRELGWRSLNRALQRQVAADGEYVQHSANYHRLMLQAVLLADAVRRGRSELWPDATQQALARASHWLFALLDSTSGRVPNLGANDGALLLPLSQLGFEDYRPTVQAAARAFLRTGLPSGEWDELALWLGLPEAGHTADSNAYAGEHLRAPGTWAYLRASSARTRLGHMDQLHVDLWWRGLNVAADAGTYLYNALSPWDNPLVAARVHNGLTIDGCESMTRAGRFLVLDWYPAYARRVLMPDSPVGGRIIAHHDGFRQLGLQHERTLDLVPEHRWRVQDDVTFLRRQTHTLRLHWLLADGEWHLQQRGSEVRLRIRLPGGWMSLLLGCHGTSAPPRVTLVRAGRLLRGEVAAQPFEGWISPTYGRKKPAISLALEVTASGTCSLTSEFVLPH